MRYNGGKTQMIQSYGMGEFWRAELTKLRPARFVDACCGSAAVTTFVKRNFPEIHVLANDIHPSLVALLKAVASGWVPPDTLTSDEYLRLKSADSRGEVSALIGFAGFACSFGAQWFQGNGVPYLAPGGRRSLLRDAPFLGNVEFRCQSYVDLLCEVSQGDLWYFDKPYESTTGYKGTPKFDHALFWQKAQELSSRVTVLVSEFAAPAGWEEVWSVERKLRTRGGEMGAAARTTVIERVDRIFKFAGSNVQ